MQATAVLSSGATRTIAYSRLGDETLASRAAAGDTAAYSALYERYYGPLLGYCRSILLDAEDARDATQNALENALRALPRRDTDRPVKPWLYRIAHNEAINIVRRRQPQTVLDEQAGVLSVPGPEVDSETRSRLSQLVSDLRELPERQRGALVMRELSGLSYDEIGGALGVSNEAARRAVFDARIALHDADDGRATACVNIRHKLSDGDRRSLRARSIRAHLRSCDDCASFQRAITVRQGDLHLIGWLPGATGLSVLGGIGAAGGAGGAGGGALIVAGGSSAVAGGGIGWAALPVAVKSLAVAAAVVGTGGAAAVELRHVTRDSAPAPQAQVAQPAAPHRAAPALASPHTVVSSVAALKAATPSPTRIRAIARSGSKAHVSVSVTTHNNAAVLTTTQRSHANSSASTPSAPATRAPGPAAAAPHAATPASKATPTPIAATAPAKSAAQIAIDKLTAYQAQIRAAYQQAISTAAAGGTSAIQTASRTLSQTLSGIVPLIQRVLASVGLKLPTTAAAPATTAPAASKPSLSNVLRPVQQVLGGVSALLQKLFARKH